MFDGATTGLIAYAIGAVSWTTLALLVATSWRGGPQGATLLVAAIVTAIWCWLEIAVAATASARIAMISQVSEILAVSCWLLIVARVLRVGEGVAHGSAVTTKLMLWSVIAAGMLLTLRHLLPWEPLEGLPAAGTLHVVSQPVLGSLGLVLIGDSYRRADESARWASQHLYAGLTALFSYQLLLFVTLIVFARTPAPIWELRGLLLAALAPLVAVSVARNNIWSVELFVSRTMVMLAVAFLGSAAYLITVTALGHYVRVFAGDWGAAAQLVFMTLALALLLMVLTSRQIRANARVFVDKHFFIFRYDYRSEWLRLIETMSKSDTEDARVRSIRALANLLDSPGGALWLRDAKDRLVYQASWRGSVRQPASISLDSHFAAYLEKSAWIIDLDEFSKEPDRYPGLEPPSWVCGYPRVWLVIPLLLEDELLGFVLLKRSAVRRHLNWEDHDLLKTIGRQLSGYLALTEATEELIEARQFEGFNRLTAYLVHDLKNVTAQLNLVVSNARKHRDNREFVDDAVRTVENAAGKMNRMLDSLRKGIQHSEQRPRLVELGGLLAEAVAGHEVMRPSPKLVLSTERAFVSIDPDRLKTVVGHLIQNAQEATPDDGQVRVTLKSERGSAIIEIIDSGSGMDERFLSDRLFRPFDTTKGSAGMGIGAYECREFVRAAGGAIDVQSQPGEGTVFALAFPEAEAPIATATTAQRAG